MVVAALFAACGDDTTGEDAALVDTTATTAAPQTTTTVAAAADTTIAPDAATDTTTADPGAAILVAVADYCVTDTRPDDTLNLRAGPGTEFADIGDLAFDAAGIRTTGTGAYDSQGRLWYEIFSGQDRVWAASWFLAPDGSADCGSSVTAAGGDSDTPQVLLGREGLEVGGVGYPLWSLQFDVGESGYADEIVVAVTGELGEPSFDSDWGPPGDNGQARSVRWGSTFSVFFSNDVGKPDTAPGGLLCSAEGSNDGVCFDGFKYFGDPSGVSSEIPGITVGSTVEALIAAAQTFEPLLRLSGPDSSTGIRMDDLYRWVRYDDGSPWGLQVGVAEFGGTLCFLTDQFGAEPPEPSVTIVMIGTWCSP
jgi:hypothetical protein